MTPPGRWLRLDVGCFQSEWLAGLDPLAQFAWVRLLMYVKASGTDGSAKRPGPTAVAKEWSIPAVRLREMEEAALADGALRVEGGFWVVTGWAKYQKPDRTNSIRKKRLRESRSASIPAVRGRYGGGTRRATKTETRTKTETELQLQHQEESNTARPTDVVISNGNGAHPWNGAIVLDAWLKRFPIAAKGLSPKERSKYGAACKRLSEQHSKDEVAAAFLGIEKLYPHSNGEPWDPLTLEKKFGLALAAISNHPKVKAQRDKDALMDEINRRNGG